MPILGPWRGSAPGSPSTINGASSLARGLLFAFAGHHGYDVVSGTRPANTGVVESAAFGKRSWLFSGGAAGSSELNFGLNTTTNNLGHSPATWAFVGTVDTLTDVAFACQSDNNSSSGWQIGYRSGPNAIGAEMTRNSANVRSQIAEVPVANVPFSFVVTYDGSEFGAGIKIYLNGRLGTVTGAADGSGGTSPTTTEPLYIGRHRYTNAVDHNGHVFVALISSRVWTDAEAKAFNDNPYQVFVTPRAPAVMTGAGSGMSANPIAAAFGLTGSLSSLASGGTVAGTFGLSGTLSPATIGGTIGATFGLTGTLSAGDHGGTIAASFGFSGALGSATIGGTIAAQFGLSGALSSSAAGGQISSAFALSGYLSNNSPPLPPPPAPSPGSCWGNVFLGGCADCWIEDQASLAKVDPRWGGTPAPAPPPSGCPVPGIVLYDAVNPIAEIEVEGLLFGFGSPGAFEFTGIDFTQFGSCPIKIAIDLDARMDLPGGSPLVAYLAPPGLRLGGFAAVSLASPGIDRDTITQVYAHYAMEDPSTHNPFSIVQLTGVPLSIYFHPPIVFPTFNDCVAFFKNTHIVITSA